MKERMPAPAPAWIAVDLDGSLTPADLFAEGLIRMVLLQPWKLLRFALSMRWSIPRLKHFVATQVPLDLSVLPFRAGLLDLLKAKKAAGSRLILATAANEAYAEAVAQQLGIFDHVLASDADSNLKAERKLNSILAVTGTSNLAYYGDARADFVLFSRVSRPVLVGPSKHRQKRFRAACPQGEIFDGSNPSYLRAAVRALRPYQWTKNTLFLLPAITSVGLYDVARFWNPLLGALLFCLLSSGIYLFNDLSDLGADRRHPRKHTRPIASGAFPALHALLLGVTLVTVSLGIIAIWRPPGYGLFILYFVLSSLYTLRLKQLAIADVLILASFYVLRIVLGAELLALPYTTWFLSFVTLVFVSLGFLKRFVEVKDGTQSIAVCRRAYSAADATLLLVAGVTASMTAMVMLALYTHSAEVQTLYQKPQQLLGLCVPYLYFVLKIWHQAVNGQVHYDPVIHIIRLRDTYAVAAIGVFIILVARYGISF